MNRFNILGSVHTVIAYSAALNAVRLDDATSDASVAAFGWMGLALIVIYLIIELVFHAKHRTIARSFEEVYAVGSADLQYQVNDTADPTNTTKILQWPRLPGAWGGEMDMEQRKAFLAAGNPEPPPKQFAGKGLGVDEDGNACHSSGKPCARVGADK